MFKLVYNLENKGNFNSFVEAFADLYDYLYADLQKGTSWQVVETAIWIEHNNHPMMFYEARDYACNIGLLVNGKLNRKMVEDTKRLDGVTG